MNKNVAEEFFKACETGKGWEECKAYCHSDATFSCQSKVLGDIKTLEAYTNWMVAAVHKIFIGCSYKLKSFTYDDNTAVFYGIFNGAHTGEGGPIPPTGKSFSSDYVYVIDFKDGKISHLTKIWNSELNTELLGWN